MAKQLHKIIGTQDAIRYGRGVTKISIAITGGNTLTLSANDCGLSTEEFASKLSDMIDEVLTEPMPVPTTTVADEDQDTELHGEE